MLRGGLGRRAQHRRSPGVPSAFAAGMGTARGRAHSGAWPGTAAGQDELTPLPAKGPRATAPEDGAAAPVLVGAALGLAVGALITLPLPPQSLAGPRSLQQAIRPLGALLPAPPWLPSSLASSSYRNPRSHALPSQKTRREPFPRASGNPAGQPASPSRSLAPRHSVATHRGQGHPQARGGQGQLPASLPLVMSPAWPGPFGRARMLGAVLAAFPGGPSACAGEAAAPCRAGVLPGKRRFPCARLVLHSAGPGQCEEVA